MLTFFRRIRKGLLGEGATSKYLLYAIGEIALVVIGILIALQINKWNEYQKTRTVERAYLMSLQKEFNSNYSKLENTMERNTTNADNALELTKHTGPGESTISEEAIGKLIFGAINGEVQYRPSSGVLDEIISSGKLGIFTNDSLRNFLSSWSGLMLSIRFQEKEHSYYRSELMRNFNSRGNVRKAFIDSYGEILGLTTSRFDNKSNNLINDHEFDSNLVGFVVTSRWLNSSYYAGLKDHITEILKLTQYELDKL